MKKLVLLPAFLLLISTLHGQNGIDRVVSDIEKNNLTLRAMRQQMEAEKIGNKTGIFPANPEAGYGYLWGSPSAIGKRTDVSVEQSFDFPSAYHFRSQIAGLRDRQAESGLEQGRMQILLQARLLCIDLVYTNALEAELKRQLSDAGRTAEAYRLKFKTGESGLPDYNKAQLALLNARQAWERNAAERKMLISALKVLNGGVAVELNDTLFPQAVIPADFEEMYRQAESGHPGIQWLQLETDVSRREVKLNDALALPGFSTGYMSEKVVGEHFQGITLGITIPLWADKNRVKFAKAKTLAAESREIAGRMELRQSLKASYDKAAELQKMVVLYRENLAALDNSEMLLKALNMGETSLIDYLMELSLLYQSRERLLELERDLHKTVAEMRQYL